MYIPNSRWTWCFVVISIIQAIAILTLESYVFATFQTHLKPDEDTTGDSKTIPTFLSLYIFGFIYELVLVYDALRLKNTIQVIGICICNVGLLIYGAVQIQQIDEAVSALVLQQAIDTNMWHDTRPILIAIPCIISVGSILMAGVAWKLYDEFAWTIYKHISADLRMKRRYLTYQIYIALLKFDFFFFLGFTVQFIIIVTGKTDTEFALTIAAIPVTIVILLFAAFFTRKENTIGMIVVIFFYIAGSAYFLFKLVRMYQPSKAAEYSPARHSLTFFGVITLLLIFSTIANAVMCTLNFNKGLKRHITQDSAANDEEKTTELTPQTPSQAGPRMVID